MSNKHGIRSSKRVPVKLEAELVFDGSKHIGFIENVSDHGLNLLTISKKAVTTFIPGAKLELAFQPSEEKINLQCEISWVQITRNPPNDLIYRLAVEIKEPPLKYRDFFNALH
jgi:hypothetical protein